MEKVDNFQSILVVMVALAMSGLAVVAFVGWWLHGSIQSETEALEERADGLEQKVDQQTSTLAGVSTEVRGARADVARLHALVGQLRLDVDTLIHGPPSLRASAVLPEKSS